MSSPFTTIGLLICSNFFMTFAWYGHIKSLSAKPLIIAILVSWGIAFFEYVFQVPANRMGAQFFTLPQLKIIQEVITLLIFIPFSIYYMKQGVGLNYFYACICICGAVYFIFRDV